MILKRAAVAASLSLAVLFPANAQQPNQVEWKQVTSMPKGANLPAGVRADTLGIELGDTYAEARAKLAQLASEGIQPKPDTRSRAQKMIDRSMGNSSAPPITEREKFFQLEGPGATVIAASYVSEISMKRELPGSTPRTIDEFVSVYLSAPSSGHQVIGIRRTVGYPTDADQPRVADFLGPLKQKFKSEPQVYDHGSGTKYKFQFNDGRAFVSKNASVIACQEAYDINEAREIAGVNRTGECDVLIEVSVNHGISKDHAKSFIFTLSDNERAKANVGADFDFFDAYVNDLQQRTRGAPPKL